MMTGGAGSPNYKRQQPSQMGLDVGAQLAQRAQGGMMPPTGGAGVGAPVGTDRQSSVPPVAPPSPAPEPWESATKVALSEAVGRSLAVSEPSNPRVRPIGQRKRLGALGLPENEIDLLEANDPALREG